MSCYTQLPQSLPNNSLLLVSRLHRKSKGLLSACKQSCSVAGITSLSEQQGTCSKCGCVSTSKVRAARLAVDEVYWALCGVVLRPAKVAVVSVRPNLCMR